MTKLWERSLCHEGFSTLKPFSGKANDVISFNYKLNVHTNFQNFTYDIKLQKKTAL